MFVIRFRNVPSCTVLLCSCAL